ncbi:MAG: hypothetical protein MUC49_02145 [Raineya sp.]|jgi:hypothetical protein|nr:hypothetical protein [Raineya sp.]
MKNAQSNRKTGYFPAKIAPFFHMIRLKPEFIRNPESLTDGCLTGNSGGMPPDYNFFEKYGEDCDLAALKLKHTKKILTEQVKRIAKKYLGKEATSISFYAYTTSSKIKDESEWLFTMNVNNYELSKKVQETKELDWMIGILEHWYAEGSAETIFDILAQAKKSNYKKPLQELYHEALDRVFTNQKDHNWKMSFRILKPEIVDTPEGRKVVLKFPKGANVQEIAKQFGSSLVQVANILECALIDLVPYGENHFASYQEEKEVPNLNLDATNQLISKFQINKKNEH